MAGKKPRDNLVPNSDRTPEQLKQMGAKGGKASGVAKRKKRATRELVRAILTLTPKASRKTQAALVKIGYDIEAEGAPTVEQLIQMSIASRAMAGDLASARFLYDYAQVPDLRATLERERIRAAKQLPVGAARDIEDLSPLVDLLAGKEPVGSKAPDDREAAP